MEVAGFELEGSITLYLKAELLDDMREDYWESDMKKDLESVLDEARRKLQDLNPYYSVGVTIDDGDEVLY